MVDLDLVARSGVNVMVTSGDDDQRIALARTLHDCGVGKRPARFVCVFQGKKHQVCADDVDEWFARAAGGTLFIDRVGHLSAEAQDRLVQLLTRQLPHDAPTAIANRRVRVVTGSNRSLGADIAVGAFSDELFYRLNVVHIDLTPRFESGEGAMKARDIMSPLPHTCGPHTDLATVTRVMWDHDCGFVPVVDTAGRVVGVVTDRDICIATATRRLLPEHISVAEVMTTPIHACQLDDAIRDVLSTMQRFRVRRVPVLDAGGRLQGVISLNDIVLASSGKREPKASEVVATMAAICAHRTVDVAVV
jgi:CBS domain-containing protein